MLIYFKATRHKQKTRKEMAMMPAGDSRVQLRILRDVKELSRHMLPKRWRAVDVLGRYDDLCVHTVKRFGRNVASRDKVHLALTL